MPGLMMRVLIAMVLTAGLTTLLLAADPITVGQKVEVREGDTWSAASIIGHEGRKYQVHYNGSDASTDEWVTVDRIRATQGKSAPATQPVTARKPAANDAFAIGDKIECKWGGLWRKAVVVRKSNDWTLVLYDNVFYEWVQPWRLRTRGSTTDTDQDSSPRPNVKKFTPAPTDPPDQVSKDDATDKTNNSTATKKDPQTDLQDGRLSETIGPAGNTIIKAELTGKDLEPALVSVSPPQDPDPSCTAPRMLLLNHGAPAFGVKTGLIVNPQGRFAMLSFTPFSGQDMLSIQRIELGRSDAYRVTSLAPRLVALAISTDGKRALTRSEYNLGHGQWRMDLWNVDAETPKVLLSFRPYDAAEDGSDEVLWASYLDGTHVLTCSRGHTVTLWQITDTSVKEIYTLQGDGTVHPHMSPGGKYMVVGFAGQAMVCEAMTGTCVARCTAITDADGMVSTLNRDLSRLVLSGGQRLVICDLVHDTVLLDVGLPEEVFGDSVDWVAPNLLLIDNRWVFDTEHRAMVWEYTIPKGLEHEVAPAAHWVGDRLWMVAESGSAYSGGSGKGVLTSISPVDAKVLAADKHLTDGVFLLQLGMQVSLEVNINNATPEEKQKVIDRLTKRLQIAGFVVADNQPIKLVAETKAIDSRQLTYYPRMGGGGSNETVTVSNTLQSLSFVIDSKPLWSMNSTVYGAAPYFVYHSKDKTVAQTLEEENKPRLDWFTSINLPKSILKPQEPAGSSVYGMVTGRTRPAQPVHP